MRPSFSRSRPSEANSCKRNASNLVTRRIASKQHFSSRGSKHGPLHSTTIKRTMNHINQRINPLFNESTIQSILAHSMSPTSSLHQTSSQKNVYFYWILSHVLANDFSILGYIASECTSRTLVRSSTRNIPSLDDYNNTYNHHSMASNTWLAAQLNQI